MKVLLVLMWLVDLGEVQWPLPSLLSVARKIYEPRLSRKGGASSSFLPYVIAAPRGVPRITNQALPSSLAMTRPREPETGDSLTDSAEESQAGAAPGSQESARVNAEQRHFNTRLGNSQLKLQVCREQLFEAILCLFLAQKKPLIPVLALLSSLPRPGNGPQDLSGRMKQQTGSEISGEREAGSPARRGPCGQMSTPPHGLSVCERETNLGGPVNILAGQFFIAEVFLCTNNWIGRLTLVPG